MHIRFSALLRKSHIHAFSMRSEETRYHMKDDHNECIISMNASAGENKLSSSLFDTNTYISDLDPKTSCLII